MPVGPSGPVVVFSATKELTDAQIKALPTTPVEVIPAPGPGKVIRWISANVILDNASGAYDPPGTDAFWQLCYLTNPVPQEASGLLAITAMNIPGVYEAPVPALNAYNSAEGYLTTGLTGADDISDVGLGIADIYNGVANYTGGNATNTLKVTVVYTIVDA